MKYNLFKGKNILITGHSGFKGSWMCRVLKSFGANVYGYSLKPERESAYNAMNVHDVMSLESFNNILDMKKLKYMFSDAQPDIVFHLAAQPLVRLSYSNPIETFSVNAIGTANVLEIVRHLDRPCSVVCITTDKVYENNETGKPFVESDRLGGYDPYSSSKAAAEIVIDSYRKSFFSDGNVRLASARAGNVIGGGDFSKDRIMTDIVKAVSEGKPVILRNPNSIRPWQHVLESISGYMTLAGRMLTDKDPKWSSAWNFGPDAKAQKTVEYVTDKAIDVFGKGKKTVDMDPGKNPHEAGLLTLDSSRANCMLGWIPKWDVDTAITKTVEWYKAYNDDIDMVDFTDRQIKEYFNA